MWKERKKTILSTSSIAVPFNWILFGAYFTKVDAIDSQVIVCGRFVRSMAGMLVLIIFVLKSCLSLANFAT